MNNLMDISLFLSTIKNSLGAISSVQSNEALRERITFIYEQLDVIRKANESAVEELSQLKEKNIELEKQIAAYREAEQFIQHRGAAFRKNSTGGYTDAVYCPNCFIQVGTAFHDFPYTCKKCGWRSPFQKRQTQEIMQSLPDNR